MHLIFGASIRADIQILKTDRETEGHRDSETRKEIQRERQFDCDSESMGLYAWLSQVYLKLISNKALAECKRISKHFSQKELFPNFQEGDIEIGRYRKKVAI